MTIHVIHAQYVPPPRRGFRYKYEVVDDSSPYNAKVDWAESNVNLKQGHTYVVRMNDLQQNPRVEELVQELEEDLTPYVDALARLGAPSTAQKVAEDLTRVSGSSTTVNAAKLRLDRLVDAGRAQRSRGSGRGHPYLYEVVAAKTE